MYVTSTHGLLCMLRCKHYTIKHCHKIILQSSLTLLVNYKSAPQPADDQFLKIFGNVLPPIYTK